MSHYRIYLLNAAGHFARAIVCPAESDEEALRAAAACDHPHGFEVWDRGRRVRPASLPLRAAVPDPAGTAPGPLSPAPATT